MRITDKQGGSLFSDDLKTLLKTKDVNQRAKLFEDWFDYTIEGKQAAFMEAYTHPRNLPGGKETPKALAELNQDSIPPDTWPDLKDGRYVSGEKVGEVSIEILFVN